MNNLNGCLDIINDEIIHGWYVDLAHNNDVFEASLYINNVFYASVQNNLYRSDLVANHISPSIGGFTLVSPFRYFKNGLYHIKLCIDQTIIAEKDYENRQQEKIFSIYQSQRTTTVIIVVCDQCQKLSAWLETILISTPPEVKIIIIDDRLTDQQSVQELQNLANDPRILLLRNAKQIGLVDSYNRGMSICPEDHVLLLQPEVQLPPYWFYSMLIASQSQTRIATVSPLDKQDIDPKFLIYSSEEDFALAVKQTSALIYPTVAVGRAFCLFINRDCLNVIGYLNGIFFSYNDAIKEFCLRAQRHSYRNIINDQCYISNLTQKDEYSYNHSQILNLYYPEYEYICADPEQNMAWQVVQYHIRQAVYLMQSCQSARKNILYILATKNGGTPQTNEDLMREMSACANCYLLVCDSKQIEIFAYRDGHNLLIQRYRLKKFINPFDHCSDEYDQVVYNFLLFFAIDLVHIRHLCWQSFNVIPTIKKIGLPIVFSFHDFYMISPNHNLIDNCSNFIGDDYVKDHSEYISHIWRNYHFPFYAQSWRDFWIQRSSAILQFCDILITTSTSAKKLLCHKLDLHNKEKDFLIIPHGRTFPNFYHLQAKLKKGEKIRLLVLGNINASKGGNVLLALADYDQEGLFEFHLLGDENIHPQSASFILHGKYQRNLVHEKVRDIKPHIGIIFSIWDETYCHTLTELWSMGIPAICFDFGTIKERLANFNISWIVDFADIPILYQTIKTICYNQEEQCKKEQNLLSLQANYLTAYTAKMMASEYLHIYKILLNKKIQNAKYKIALLDTCTHLSKFSRIFAITENNFTRQTIYIKMNVQQILATMRMKMIDAVLLYGTEWPEDLSEEFLSLAQQYQIKIILDLDDNPLEQTTYRDLQSFTTILQKADLICVANQYLQGIVSEYNSNCILLPTRLAKNIWLSEPPCRKKDGLLRALYLGNSIHQTDPEIILEALDAIYKQYPNFRLLCSNVLTDVTSLTTQYPFIEEIILPCIDYIDYVHTLYEQIDCLDFCLAPLEDVPCNKIGDILTIPELAALGLPCIISDCQSSREFIIPGIIKTENTQKAWLEAVLNVIADLANGINNGIKARQYVLDNYLPDTAFFLWLDRIFLVDKSDHAYMDCLPNTIC